MEYSGGCDGGSFPGHKGTRTIPDDHKPASGNGKSEIDSRPHKASAEQRFYAEAGKKLIFCISFLLDHHSAEILADSFIVRIDKFFPGDIVTERAIDKMVKFVMVHKY